MLLNCYGYNSVYLTGSGVTSNLSIKLDRWCTKNEREKEQPRVRRYRARSLIIVLVSFSLFIFSCRSIVIIFFENKTKKKFNVPEFHKQTIVKTKYDTFIKILSASSACRIGKHGPGCNTTCSGQCVGQHNPCHHIDGLCYLGCVQDDQSPMCRRTRGIKIICILGFIITIE